MSCNYSSEHSLPSGVLSVCVIVIYSLVGSP